MSGGSNAPIHLKLTLVDGAQQVIQQRRVAVASAKYSALEEVIGRFVRGPWTAAYTDDDGDEVTVSGDAEWAECLAVVAAMGPTCVRLRIAILDGGVLNPSVLMCASVDEAPPGSAAAADSTVPPQPCSGMRSGRGWWRKLVAKVTVDVNAALPQYTDAVAKLTDMGYAADEALMRAVVWCEGDVDKAALMLTERAASQAMEGGDDKNPKALGCGRWWWVKRAPMEEVEAAVCEYPGAVEKLTEMGFAADDTLKRTLVWCQGDVNKTALVLTKRAAWWKGGGGWWAKRWSAEDVEAALPQYAEAVAALTGMGYAVDETLKRTVVWCKGDVEKVVGCMEKKAAWRGRRAARRAEGGDAVPAPWRGGWCGRRRGMSAADVEAASVAHADAFRELTEVRGYTLDEGLVRAVVRFAGDVEQVERCMAWRATRAAGVGGQTAGVTTA